MVSLVGDFDFLRLFKVVSVLGFGDARLRLLPHVDMRHSLHPRVLGHERRRAQPPTRAQRANS